MIWTLVEVGLHAMYLLVVVVEQLTDDCVCLEMLEDQALEQMESEAQAAVTQMNNQIKIDDNWEELVDAKHQLV
jgi:hypothetical protein